MMVWKHIRSDTPSTTVLLEPEEMFAFAPVWEFSHLSLV